MEFLRYVIVHSKIDKRNGKKQAKLSIESNGQVKFVENDFQFLIALAELPFWNRIVIE